MMLRLIVTFRLVVETAILIGFASHGFSSSLLAADAPLSVGAAETDITPPQGFPIAGYYHERLAEGTIDPLKAKAIVFRQGDRAAAMVVCDLTGIARDLCEEVRKRASEKTGIPASAIAISATHSHTAPDYSKHLYQFLQGDRSPVGKVDPAAPPYAQSLIDGIVQAIVDADQRRAVSKLSAGSVLQTTPVSFNRRFVMRDGSVQTWQSLSNPNVVRAAGPIDPEIGFVSILDADGKPRSVLSNFALHLDTVGGLRWSGDYPYFIEQTLRKQFGPQLVSIFGTGCCGDINHSDPTRTERNRTDMIGNSIGTTLESGLPQGRPLANPMLQTRSLTVPLPLQDPSREQIERARQLLHLIRDGGKVDFLDQVTAYKTLMLTQFRPATRNSDDAALIGWGLSHTWSGIGDALPVDVQTITLGDEVAIVFLPGEVFVDLGLAIKRGSPFRTTLVIELSNCVETVYIPTRAATAGGSYEVTNSTLLPGGGEMLVEAALTLLRESAQAVSAR
jgi:hypothetical protein